jgi:hypothetical protein
MTTVKQLISLLQENHDPDEAIVFQYLVQEHTSYSPEEFENLAEIVMDSPDFGSDTTQFFLSALEEAEYSLDEEEEEE